MTGTADQLRGSDYAPRCEPYFREGQDHRRQGRSWKNLILLPNVVIHANELTLISGEHVLAQPLLRNECEQ